MAYVITDPCISICDTACVDVCPVDAIHGPRSSDDVEALEPARRSLLVLGPQLFIDPSSCISCALCEPECPVTAIFDEDHVPRACASATERNAAYFA
jgi:ferredoxin